MKFVKINFFLKVLSYVGSIKTYIFQHNICCFIISGQSDGAVSYSKYRAIQKQR